jgi:hypothetical protein
MTKTKESSDCDKDDLMLEKFTSLRFLLMGLLLLYRTSTIYRKSDALRKAKKEDREHPFQEHPDLTDSMISVERNPFVRFVFAGIIFIQSEGIGLVIYFVTSAILDNTFIYIVENVTFCEYVMQAALYSMALLTFLPTVIIAFCFQGSLYDRGSWNPCGTPADKTAGGKIYFILLMMSGTVLSFFLRLQIVYRSGWDDFVDNLMQHELDHYKVVAAIVVPPIVDALQTIMLICAALFTRTHDSPKDYSRAPCEGEAKSP